MSENKKNKKLTREQKKAIKSVVKKYWRPKKTEITSKGGAVILGTVSAANISLVALDVMATGGMFSMAYYTLWAGYFGNLSMKMSKQHFSSEFRNVAGQKIIAPEAVCMAFEGMEKELKVLFNRRAAAQGTQRHKEIQVKINTVFEDVKTLRPVYEVQERGVYKNWASKYVFIDTSAQNDKDIKSPYERRYPLHNLKK